MTPFNTWVEREGVMSLRLMLADTHDLDITITRKQNSLEATVVISYWTGSFVMEKMSNFLNNKFPHVFKTEYIHENHKHNKKYGECIYQEITANSMRDAKIHAEIWIIELMRFLKIEAKND